MSSVSVASVMLRSQDLVISGWLDTNGTIAFSMKTSVPFLSLQLGDPWSQALHRYDSVSRLLSVISNAPVLLSHARHCFT